jgi:hypothetical protein
LNSAKDRINRLIEERKNTFEKLKATFGISQVHSEHHNLSFMTTREEALQLDRYFYMLENLIKDYGEENDLDGFYDKLESKPLIPIGN